MSEEQDVCRAQIVVCEGGKLPTKGSAEAAGWDLYANLQGSPYILFNTPNRQETVIGPGGRLLIPVGFILGLPEGWEAQIRPRSGIALSSGITVTNAPGTIDSDYRAQIAVILQNTHPTNHFMINHGDRVAQMVIKRVPRVEFEVLTDATKLRQTARGVQGYGSTGTK